MKQTIAVDVDDVLAAGAQGFVDFANQHWGTRLTIDDYDERWSRMWGVDHAEEKRRAHMIYKSGAVGTFAHFDEAKPVLLELAKSYKLVIITSRVRLVQKDTLEWIDKHYQGIFKEIHFAGFYDKLDPGSHKHTKAELSRSVGADYLIDDHPKHCFAAAKVGIQALLFGDYRWNRQLGRLPNNVTRVRDWPAVLRYFERENS